MRCACHNCGTYMVHSESFALGCVCPECGRRCGDCLGTNTLISKDELKRLKNDPTFLLTFGAGAFNIPPAGDDLPDTSGIGYDVGEHMSGPEPDDED